MRERTITSERVVVTPFKKHLNIRGDQCFG